MIAEALAVVGGDDHEGLAREAREPIEQRTERVIGPGDFAGVRILGVPARELVRRLVRRVRIEQVYPGEPLVRTSAGPGERGRYDCVSAPFRQREVDGATGFADAVVVDIEAGVQAKTLIERESAHEGSGGEAEALHPHGERGGIGLDSIAVVVADAVLVRVDAGQQAGMRRQRDHGVCVGEGEPRAACRERIDARRAGASAIGGHGIRPQRVDGDDQDIALRVGRDDESCWTTSPPPDGREGCNKKDDGGESARASRDACARSPFAKPSSRLVCDRIRSVGTAEHAPDTSGRLRCVGRGDITHEIA